MVILSVVSVCPFVRQFPPYLLNQLTVDLDFFACVWVATMTLTIRRSTYSKRLTRGNTRRYDLLAAINVRGKGKGKRSIAVRNTPHRYGTHMPYEITLCYLPPGRGDIPALTPAEAGTRFSDHRGMQGCVDLVGWLHTEMIYPPEDGHPSRY